MQTTHYQEPKNWAYMMLTPAAKCGRFVQLMALWKYLQLSKDETILLPGL